MSTIYMRTASHGKLLWIKFQHQKLKRAILCIWCYSKFVYFLCLSCRFLLSPLGFRVFLLQKFSSFENENVVDNVYWSVDKFFLNCLLPAGFFNPDFLLTTSINYFLGAIACLQNLKVGDAGVGLVEILPSCNPHLCLSVPRNRADAQ